MMQNGALLSLSLKNKPAVPLSPLSGSVTKIVGGYNIDRKNFKDTLYFKNIMNIYNFIMN